MKKIIIVLGLVLQSIIIIAQDYDKAIALRVGTQYALSYKTFRSHSNAIEVIASVARSGGKNSYSSGAYFQYHVDVSQRIPALKAYFGLGGMLNFNKRFRVGPSGSIGLEFQSGVSVVFIEISPYYLFGEEDVDMHGSIGFRYILSNSSGN